MTTFSVSPQQFHDSALCMDTDAFSLIMIIIVVFIEKHNKQKKVVQCQIFKLEMEILFFLSNANKKESSLCGYFPDYTAILFLVFFSDPKCCR